MSDAESRGVAKPRRWTLWLPLGLFVIFAALVMYGMMRPADRNVASAMIGKPLPEFDLRPAITDRPGLSSAVYSQGKPRLLNVFASWCIPCAIEAPQLDALKAQGISIDGIAIRDTQEDLEQFLANNGNPFERIGADDVSAVQLAIGSSGVPETFVVDGNGIIRYQHIGPIDQRDIPVLLEKLKEAGF